MRCNPRNGAALASAHYKEGPVDDWWVLPKDRSTAHYSTLRLIIYRLAMHAVAGGRPGVTLLYLDGRPRPPKSTPSDLVTRNSVKPG